MSNSKYNLLGDEYDKVINNLMGKPVIMYGSHEIGPYLFYKGTFSLMQNCDYAKSSHLHFLPDDECLDLWGIAGIIDLQNGDHSELQLNKSTFITGISVKVTEWESGDGGGPYYHWVTKAEAYTRTICGTCNKPLRPSDYEIPNIENFNENNYCDGCVSEFTMGDFVESVEDTK